MIYFIFGVVVGFAPFAYSKGWLDTPIAFVINAVKGWGGTK